MVQENYTYLERGNHMATMGKRQRLGPGDSGMPYIIFPVNVKRLPNIPMTKK